MKLHCSAGSLL